MKIENLAHTLEATASSVLGEAAFAMVDGPSDWDEPPQLLPAKDMIAARLQFQGPFTGSMFLAAPVTLAHELAANMLGLELVDPEAALRRGDAVGELLNMICGNLLPLIAGSAPEFSIGAPATVDCAAARAMAGSHPEDLRAVVALLVEDEPVEAALLLDDFPTEAATLP